MAINFHCEVDTEPMARSIDSVSHQIDKTTVAVVGMQTAVILAEKKAADHVCDNVNRGFHSLIRSQISQKMAGLRSQVDSHLMQLNQQAKQLNNIRQRMERDYRMLAQRYLKLFTAINRNLKQRITELDRPAINFAERDIENLANRTHRLAAVVPVGQEESVAKSQDLLVSNLKARGEQLIKASKSFLDGSLKLRIITSRILLPEKIASESRTLYLPAVIAESRIDEADNRSTRVYVSENACTANTAGAIRAAVNASMSAMQWSTPRPLAPEVSLRVADLASDAGLSDRVRKYILSMVNSAQVSSPSK